MTDYAIVGAGLAGLNLAGALLERDVPAGRITLVDGASPHRGSSAPGALLHPFPGRHVAPKNENFRVFRRARRFVEWVRRWSAGSADGSGNGQLVRRLPMVRPLKDDRLGRSLRRSWEEQRGGYPDWLQVEVGPAADYLDLYPGMERWDEVLVYQPAYVVDMAALRRRLLARLRDEGVRLVESSVTTITPAPDAKTGRVTLGLSGDDSTPERLKAATTVLAMGFGLDAWFPELATSGRGGELMVTDPPDEARLDCILNASGHVGPRPDGRWVAGSTWWAPGEFRGRDDERARQALLERCGDLLPELHRASTTRIWRGIRCSFGDHQPLVGPLPQLPNLHVLGAFGSKGLFRIPYFTERLADHLIDEAPLPDLVRADRISTRKWRLDKASGLP